VLTCTGESFASRVASSLLSAIDLPELITTSQADYEALFNTQLFTHHIEVAYRQMCEKYHADLPPNHIRVPFIP